MTTSEAALEWVSRSQSSYEEAWGWDLSHEETMEALAAASAAAQIASALVFCQDAEEVARGLAIEMVGGVVGDVQAEVLTEGAGVALERLARAATILQEGMKSGARNPAMGRALRAIQGQDEEAEPRQVEVPLGNVGDPL